MAAEHGTILERPEGEREKQLRLKLEIYQTRWGIIKESLAYLPPEIRQVQTAQYHVWYSLSILETLLDEGTVDSYKVSRKMFTENGEQFDPNMFDLNFEKILQYVTTGIAFGKPLPPLS